MAITNISIDMSMPDNAKPTFVMNIQDDAQGASSIVLGPEGVLHALQTAATRAQSRADAALTAAPPVSMSVTPIN